MKKVILTKGLPASGKTTWAREYQKENPNTVLVNKDEIRAMLHQGVWSKGREQFVLAVRDFIIKKAVDEGHDVIVHDTNLHSKHKNNIIRLVADKATVEYKSFTDVPLEECIKRDRNRVGGVGDRVIKKMYNQFLKPEIPEIKRNENLPNAVVCDIDGTLALFGDANPYERDFLQDRLNEPVAKILNDYSYKAMRIKDEVILVSGRKDAFRDQTEQWLKKNHIWYTKLFMRSGDDTRKDVIVKGEIYEKYIKDQYNVLFVLDDRDQVVEFWRSIGLTCLQVAEGDF